MSIGVKRTVFVVVGVALLTPLPAPIATLYVTLIPSALVLFSTDVEWYFQFWRFGAIAAVATGVLCWLTAPALFNAPDHVSGPRHGRAALGGIFVGLVVLAVVAFQDPTERGPLLTTVDTAFARSCHNLLRGGRDSIGAQVRMDLDISDDEWADLTMIFEEFAVEHQISFRNDSEVRPEVVRTLYLSVCSDNVTIKTHEQRWASRSYNSTPGRGVGIPVYEVHPNSEWKSLTRQLIDRLEQTWPTKVRYRDRVGRIIPMPENLQHDGAHAIEHPSLQPDRNRPPSARGVRDDAGEPSNG